MKVSSVILLATFCLLLLGMFISNVLLKKEYDSFDKSDTYWTYGKILEQPFKHVKVEGGNVTRIIFEPAKKSSVRVFKNWKGYEDQAVKAYVKNDTLYLTFPNAVKNAGEKRYLSYFTMVRIFSPELLSVDGHDTNFALFKLRQKNLHINLSGKSKLEVESYIHHFDSLQISQSDSSEVVFEMSPDVKVMPSTDNANTAQKTPAIVQRDESLGKNQKDSQVYIQPTSWETMYVNLVEAKVQGVSLLDVGHAQIGSLKLNISDTSGIILSGGGLRRFRGE